MKKILLTTTALHQPWNEGDWDMTDGNTHAINQYLDEREDWDALQEFITKLEQAEARIEELEAKLAKVDAILVSRVKYAERAKKMSGSENSKRREHYRMHALSEALGEIRKTIKGETE